MVIIGIAGGSGSGKTTLVKHLLATYSKGMITHVPMDAYYRDHSHLSEEEKVNYNFDHPCALDFDLLIRHLQLLKNNISVERPVYSFLTCSRSNKVETIHPAEIILVEGLFALSHQHLRQELSAGIYLDASFENRLERSINRDMSERGRTRKAAKKRFLSMVEPMHNQFVQPMTSMADAIVDTNVPDIKSIVETLVTIIEERACLAQN